MSDIFISYARSTEPAAHLVAEALRAQGFSVWRDDELRPHQPYTEAIEARLRAARAVVVVWSAEAAKSQWVRAEAEVAREAGTLVQLSCDGVTPPLPFSQIHCVNLAGWAGDTGAPGWRQVAASVSELLGRDPAGAHDAPAAPPLPDKPSIAVLPFVNLSREEDQDYFVEGMMDEVVTALTRIRALFVIASGSTLSLKGQGVDASQAAQRLGVRYILEGSVRRSGPRVRITAKLTDAVAGVQVWADHFDDTLEDVFALQDRVALSVAGVIEPAVQRIEANRVARRPLESLGCYDLYLRAGPLRATLRKAEVLQALELLERAVALEPDFAPALAQAAGCHSQILTNNWSDDPALHRRLGVDMAERAINAGGDDALVLTHAANALAELDSDAKRAIALSGRATTLNPGSAYAWYISGVLHLHLGAPEAAIEQLERAARLDPLSRLGDMARAHIAAGLAIKGDFTAALRTFRETTFRTPRLHLVIATACGQVGELQWGRDELAAYEALTATPVAEMVKSMTGLPELRAELLEGIERLKESPPD
jgi:TolB-like protein